MNAPRLPSRSALPALAAALLLCAGCASSVRIQVNAPQETNKGQILYMMVRATEDEALIAEDYETAATRVFASPQDPSVQKVQAILPGRSVNLSLPRPEKERLALYFFYTQPGKHWKVPFDQPLPAEVVVDLGTHEIKSVQVRRR
ncbi:hypothetical protein P2318_13445 [Myxococcaceae bacterium GXIMD 01537]